MHGTVFRQAIFVACAMSCLTIVGCLNSIKNTIPAQCLTPEIRGQSRDDLEPIDFTHLGQPPATAHLIGPDDILGIHISGILGNDQEIEPETEYPRIFGNSDSGNFTQPATGSPITVMPDGSITLPYAQKFSVAGLTLPEAADKIRQVYCVELRILDSNRLGIQVNLIKPRSIQVMVLREDSINRWPRYKQNYQTYVAKRGSGATVDLPMYQNDVLHALTESGGLPGTDSANEVWVLQHADEKDTVDSAAGGTDSSDESILEQGHDMRVYKSRVIRIPLKVSPGQSLNISPNDVILRPGAVVYLPSRDREHFYVGGVIPGQQVSLPRDYELDVIDAIAMASGQAVGPPGGPLFKGSTPGVVAPPTRVLILRKTSDGEQVVIHVSLKKALQDRNERIPIQPGDVILLQYTPGEIASNIVSNLTSLKVLGAIGYFTKGNSAVRNFTGGQTK